MLGRAALLGSVFGRFLYGRMNVSLKALMPLAYGDTKKLTKEIHRVYLEPFSRAEDRVRVLHPLAASLIHSRAYFASLWTRRWIVKDTPALLVWGLKDPAFTKKHLDKMRELFTQSEVVELPGACHWPHEEEPQACVEAVRKFVGVA